jgi:AraC-like DNA-binding protein
VQQRFVGAAGLARFSTAVAGSLVDQVVRAPAPDRFRADLTEVTLGDVGLVSAAVGPLHARRHQPAGGAAGSVFLLVAQRGEGTIAHRGGQEVIGPDRLVVVPGGERFTVEYPGASSLLFVALPATRVARSCPVLDGPVRSVALQGVSLAVARQLPFLVTAGLAAREEERDALSGVADSVLHVLLGSALGDVAGDPLVALRVTAERMVERHLDDPELSVPWLARRLSVSLRQLHRAFGTGGRTAAEHLRRQRLRACARDLVASPRTGVAELAARYGFASASHLGACFRQEYGETPGAWRARHAADRDPAPR